MVLTNKQRAFLRSRAHSLEPRLKLGKAGAGDGFRKELEEALSREELVKVRLGRYVSVDLDELAETLGAVLVGQVGRNAVFFRPAAEPKLILP